MQLTILLNGCFERKRSKQSHARYARSWASDLKMIASSFNNFLWTRIIENNDAVMEINDV